MLKKIMGFLKNTYRGHLYVLYIIKTPSSIFIPWKIAKGLLDETIIKKINFVDDGNPIGLWNFTNKEQVEEKFGGSAKNLTTYWFIKFNEYFWHHELLGHLVFLQKIIF